VLFRSDAESLFFAEEEVRWSWEMAQRGHAQGMGEARVRRANAVQLHRLRR
jgi:hypothetical protein